MYKNTYILKLNANIIADGIEALISEKKFLFASFELSYILYCEAQKLHRVIQNKKHVMLTYGVVVLHDTARPHIAARTRALLKHLNW
jgi:hypothetical protein